MYQQIPNVLIVIFECNETDAYIQRYLRKDEVQTSKN